MSVPPMGHAVPVTRPTVVLRPQPHGVERIFAPKALAALHDRYHVVEVAPGDDAALDAALPEDIAVLEAVEAPAGSGSLADRIDAADWRIELPGVEPEELAAALAAFLEKDAVEVSRRTKNGLRDVDARAAVAGASAGGAAGCAILQVVVRQVTPAVRPDDVLAALAAVADLRPPLPSRAVRAAQGRLDDTGTVADPLGPDRAARAHCQGERAAV